MVSVVAQAPQVLSQKSVLSAIGLPEQRVFLFSERKVHDINLPSEAGAIPAAHP